MVYKFLGLTPTICFLIFTLGFILGTFYIGPDLDIKSRPYYRWKSLRFIWIPYQRAFSHRSFWTHSFLISDIIRVAYLLLVIFVPYSIFITLGNHDSKVFNETLVMFVGQHTYYPTSFLIGLTCSSSLHSAADYLNTYFKKKKAKRKVTQKKK